MLPHDTAAPQSPRRFGVGIDTSRYGPYAVFLANDLQPAADDRAFAESAAGSARFRQRRDGMARRHAPIQFVVRVDAAGPYADNLVHFLHRLGPPTAGAAGSAAPFTLTVSCGDPQRNQNYRAARFGGQKSDPVAARAAARFAVTEHPSSDKPRSLELRSVRPVASRLPAVVRPRTRRSNQFHHRRALTFPERALVTKDVAAGWVLELVHRYPTAPRLAEATAADVAAIPYRPDAHVTPRRDHARASLASLAGAAAEELRRDHVRQVRDVGARQQRLENLLVSAYHALPQANPRDTIPGLGAVTAAVLTAFIVAIDRFATPGKRVADFGVLPIQASRGVARDGPARGPRRYVMSRRGNDLVRRYLWMAALSAVRCNPAVRALYARAVAKHPPQKAVAVGHAMRKLLHLAFAIWKTGRPFCPDPYPWQTPAHPGGSDGGGSPQGKAADSASSPKDPAAGPTPDDVPAQPVVTAACPDRVPGAAATGERLAIDFAPLKNQLPLGRVLDQLGLTARRRGSGSPRRGACPLHRGDARGRTFSVNLAMHVFQCFAQACGRHGDVIDLWASAHGLSLRDAAIDLVRTFGLEPAPAPGTAKRNG